MIDTIDVKKSLKYKQEVHFEKFSENAETPTGYISSKEFRKRAFEKVNKFCDKHGIYQQNN